MGIYHIEFKICTKPWEICNRSQQSPRKEMHSLKLREVIFLKYYLIPKVIFVGYAEKSGSEGNKSEVDTMEATNSKKIKEQSTKAV